MKSNFPSFFLLFAFGQLFSLERPNIVFFIADDVSQDELGWYGHPVIKTPHIDSLSANGMRFDNAYLTTSSCSPSRCSIITGRYPHNTGAPELHVRLPQQQVRFPELLREAGYYTVLSGKNHMFGNKDRAFDRITGGGGPGKEEDWVGHVKDRPKAKPFFLLPCLDRCSSCLEYYQRPTQVRPQGCDYPSVPGRLTGYPRGFDGILS